MKNMRLCLYMKYLFLPNYQFFADKHFLYLFRLLFKFTVVCHSTSKSCANKLSRKFNLNFKICLVNCCEFYSQLENFWHFEGFKFDLKENWFQFCCDFKGIQLQWTRFGLGSVLFWDFSFYLVCVPSSVTQNIKKTVIVHILNKQNV